MVPGHVDTQSVEELKRNVLEVTLQSVIDNLTIDPDAAAAIKEPEPLDIVFEGTFEEVNRLYYENSWSDGLPIIPPTEAKIQNFLEFTERNPHEVLGTILPDNRSATPWNVAVNGVMAGCRPEYMPVLMALAEAMADPEYGVEHSGNTPGAETLITINGPIIKQLGFNYEQGAMRDGFLPNSSIGRFWRLYLRNVAGFLLHQNDKGTYGNTWRVVLAENEDAVAKCDHLAVVDVLVAVLGTRREVHQEIAQHPRVLAALAGEQQGQLAGCDVLAQRDAGGAGTGQRRDDALA